MLSEVISKGRTRVESPRMVKLVMEEVIGMECVPATKSPVNINVSSETELAKAVVQAYYIVNFTLEIWQTYLV